MTPTAPHRGDLIWLDFSPQAGHEQKGRRPALVLSPIEYNHKTNLALICPITSKVKNRPFEVLLANHYGIDGAVLSDQVRSLDWSVRNAEFIGKASSKILAEVFEKLGLLLDY